MRRHSCLRLLLLVTLFYIPSLTSHITALPHGVVPVNPGFGFRRLIGTDSVTPDCNDPTAPACRMSASIVSFPQSNVLILFGGIQQDAFQGTTYNDIWVYNTGYPNYDGTWQNLLPSLCVPSTTRPSCRYWHTAVILKTEMLIFGGLDVNGNKLNDLWSLNLLTLTTTLTWTQLTPLLFNNAPQPFAGHSAVALDDTRMMIMGSSDITNVAIVYTRTTNTYTITENGFSRTAGQVTIVNNVVTCDFDPTNPCIALSPMVLSNTLVYTFGGETMSSITGTRTFSNALWSVSVAGNTPKNRLIQTNDCVSTTTDVCVPSTTKPCCRSRHSLLLRDTGLYLFGGLSRQTVGGPLMTLNDMWKFDLTTETWTMLRPLDCTQPGPVCSESMASIAMPPLGSFIYFGGRMLRTGLQSLSNTMWGYNAVPSITAPLQVQTSPTTGGNTITITGNFPVMTGTIPFVYVVPPMASTPLWIPSPTDMSFATITKIPAWVPGSTCTNVVMINANTITCRTPPGVSSAARVVVETFATTFFPSQPQVYISYTPPTVTAVSFITPANNNGGTVITVVGTGFGPAYTAPFLTVLIGARACANITRMADTQLTCIAPAGAGTGIPVRVKAGDAITDQPSAINGNAMFTYQTPIVISAVVNLPAGTIASSQGGFSVVINGTGFGIGDCADTLFASLGDQRCTTTRWISSTQVICIAPPGVGNNLPITVTVGSPQSTPLTSTSNPPVLFSYSPPTLTTISQRFFSIDGNEELIISGTNFGIDAARLDIRIAGRQCTNVMLITPHFSARCVTPQFKDEVTDTIILRAGGQPQPDGNQMIVSFLIPAVSRALVFAFIVIGVICLGILGILLCYVVYRRAHKVIKASSPLFCMIAIIGGMILITAMLFLDPGGVDRNATCHASLWIGSLGFTVLLGSLVFKNYRVLKIFQDGASLQQSPITTTQLLTMIGLLLIIDGALLIGYESTAAPCSQLTSPNIFTQNIGLTIFIVMIITYKLLLILVGVHTAVRSRVIDLPEFSERHQLGYAIMVIAFAAIVLAPTSYALRTQNSASYSLRAIGLIVGSMFAILALMLPKIFAIHHAMQSYVPPQPSQQRKYTITQARPTPAIPTVTIPNGSYQGTLTKSDQPNVSRESYNDGDGTMSQQRNVPGVVQHDPIKPSVFTPPDVMTRPPPPPPGGPPTRKPPAPPSMDDNISPSISLSRPSTISSRSSTVTTTSDTPLTRPPAISIAGRGKKPLPRVPRPMMVTPVVDHDMLIQGGRSSSQQTTPRAMVDVELDGVFQANPLAMLASRSSYPPDLPTDEFDITRGYGLSITNTPPHSPHSSSGNYE